MARVTPKHTDTELLPTDAMIEAEIMLCKKAVRHCNNGSGLQDIHDYIWKQFAEARLKLAALEAARSPTSPTDGMIEAGAAALAHESDFEGRFVELHEMSKAIYREKAAAVITAALSTIPTSPREGELRAAAEGLLARMFDTLDNGNGIEADDGEKCWAVHSDDIEDLRRALLSKPVTEANGWRDIETAPTDGTRVLLSDPDGDPHIARWLLKANPPELMIAGDPEYGGWVIWHEEGEPSSIVVPAALFWQPLPEPPSLSERGKR